MKKRISISACRQAILITERGYELDIPLEIGGEERMITDIEIRGGRWYSGDRRLTRGQQEKLTQRALAIIEDDQQSRLAPKTSIGDCRRHQDLAPGKGESDHRSDNRWDRELPMVRRRLSLQVKRAGKPSASLKWTAARMPSGRSSISENPNSGPKTPP